MNRRFDIAYYYQDEFERVIAMQDPIRAQNVRSRPHGFLEIRRNLVVRYKSETELQTALAKKFLGKSIYIERQRDFCGDAFPNAVQWNENWNNLKWMPVITRSMDTITNCKSVEIHNMQKITNDYRHQLGEWMSVARKESVYVDRSWKPCPGLWLRPKDFYKSTSEDFREEFWKNRLEGTRAYDGFETLTETARFAAANEPELEKYLRVPIQDVHMELLGMVRDSGASNKCELFGRVLDKSNRIGWKMWDKEEDERSKLILVFYTLLTYRSDRFYSTFGNQIRTEFSQNQIRRVHTI